jgi:5,6-dimethylbenzimidazole synthase
MDPTVTAGRPSGAPGGRSPSAPAGGSDASDDLRDALYQVLFRRRDVRGQFTGEPVEAATLWRVLEAAHAAPSVGLSQPWDFLVIDEPDVKHRFWRHVQQERERFARSLEGERAARFAGIKIDGVLESSLSVVVTYDPDRGAPGVLGRHAIDDAGLYSVCLAIQNLWLAATAEGWGVGWVSFYEEGFLTELMGLPDRIRPVAWLCVGPVSHLEEAPDLERHGWRQRRPLHDAIHRNRWRPSQERGPDVD